MQTAFENGTLTLYLTGHVDSTNAPELEGEIRKAREELDRLLPKTDSLLF